MKVDLYKLGRRVAAARELRDLTQKELAEHAGVTQVTIARLEKARTPHVSLETVVAIADALDVSIDYLVADADDAVATRR